MATIDERVVEMRFENREFEKNVQTSLGTIAKLKEALKFDNVKDGIEDLHDSLQHFTVDNVTRQIDDVTERIGVLDTITFGMLTRIGSFLTDELMGYINAIKNALGLDMIDSVKNLLLGWEKYSDVATSTATIMASTGQSIEYVSEQIEKLNYFTDETSYSLTDMTNNIGKFTANGIDLEDASAAMKGIATWAARSGQNAGTASRVMYNLAQAIGMGSLKLQDWKSVELANMGTKEFKETAIATAKALGVFKENASGALVYLDTSGQKAKEVEVDIQNFRETLSSGWLDNEVLMATLKEYGKAAELIGVIHESTDLWASDIIELARAQAAGTLSTKQLADAFGLEEDQVDEASEEIIKLREQLALLGSEEYAFSLTTYEASQEARTFGDAMASVADAVGSAWLKVFTQLFGNVEEAKTLWWDLAENLIEVFSYIPNKIATLLGDANVNGWQKFNDELNNAGSSMEDLEKSMQHVVGSTAFSEMTKGCESFEEALYEGRFGTKLLEEALKGLTGTSQEVSSAVDLTQEKFDEYTQMAWRVRHGDFGWYEGSSGQIKRLMEEAGYTEEEARLIVKWAEASHAVHRDLTMEEAKEAGLLEEILNSTYETVELNEQQQQDMMKYYEMRKKEDARQYFIQGLTNSGAILVEVLSQIRQAFENVFPGPTADTLVLVAKGFEKVTSSVLDFLENNDLVKNAFTGLFYIAKAVLVVVGLILARKIAVVALIGGAAVGLSLIVAKMGELIDKVKKADDKSSPFIKTLRLLADIVQQVFRILYEFAVAAAKWAKEKFLEFFTERFNKLKETISSFKPKNFDSLTDFLERLKGMTGQKVLDKLITKFKELRDNFNLFNRDAKESEDNTSIFDKIVAKLGPVGRVLLLTKSKLSGFLGEVNAISEGTGTSKFVVFIGLIRKKLETLFNVLREKFPNFGSVWDSIRSKFQTAVEWLQKFKDSIIEKLEPAKQYIKTFLEENDIKLGDLLKGGALTIIAAKLIDFFTAIAKLKEPSSNPLDVITSALDPFKKTIEDVKKTIGTFSILKFAIAMALLAYSLSKLAQLDAAGMKISLATLGGALIEFISTFAIMTRLIGKKNATSMVKIGLGMVLMCWALLKFAKVVETYSKLDFGGLKGAIKVFIILELAIHTLKSIAKAAGNANFKLSNGLGLIAMVTALWLFGKVLNSYAKLKYVNSGSILKILAVLLIAIVTLNKIAKAAGNSKFKFSNGMGLIAAAVSLWILAGVINKLGKMDGGVLLKGGIALLALGAALTIMIKFLSKYLNGDSGIKFKTVFSTILLLAGIVTALVALAAVMLILGVMPANVLGQGTLMVVVALGIIIGAMFLLNKSLEKMRIGTAIGGLLLMIGMAGLLIVVAGVMAVLSSFSWKKIGKGIVAMLPIIAMFLAIGFVMKNTSTAKLVASAVALLAFALVLVVAVGAIERLAKIDAAKALQGVIALGLLLAEFAALAAATMFFPFAIAEVATLGIMMKFAEALLPLVNELVTLGKIDAKTLSLNIQNIKDVLDILWDIAERLITDLGLFDAATQAAQVVLMFGNSLRPLCDDVAILGTTDPEKAAGSLKVVEEVIQVFIDLATLIKENSWLMVQGTLAANLVRLFGESLRPLCDDVAILGGTDPEKAAGSFRTVQGLIDEMIELANMIQENSLLFVTGLLASVLVRAFGVGLKPLVEDVNKLGENADPDVAFASIASVRGLIDEMVRLAGLINDNAWLFTKGLLAAQLAKKFGEGLLDLCNAVVILGDNASPEASLASVATITEINNEMIRLAGIINNDETKTLYQDATTAAELVKKFGEGLKPICQDVATLGSGDAVTAAANWGNIETIITYMFEMATQINKDRGVYQSAKNVSEVVKKFGKALLWFIGDEFLMKFVDIDKATAGFEAAKGMIEYLVDLAETRLNDEEKINTAIGAANALGTLGTALLPVVGASFISQFVDAQKSEDGFAGATSIIDYLLKMADEKFTGEGGQSRYEAATKTAEALKGFGESLAWLVGETFVAGLTKASEAEQNFTTLEGMITFLMEKAKEFKGDEAMVRSADRVAALIKTFAGSLAGLITEEVVAGLINPDKADANFTVIKGIIDWFVATAQTFNKDDTLFSAADSTAQTLKTFANTLWSFVGSEFAMSLINATKAKASAEAVQEIVNILVGLATTLRDNDQTEGDLTNYLEKASSFMAQFGQDFTPFAQTIQDVSAYGMNIDTFGSVLGSISTLIKDIASLDSANALDRMNALVAILNGISSIAKNDKKTSGLFEEYKSTLGDISDMFDSFVETLTGKGEEMTEGLATGIKNKNTTPNDAMREIRDNLVRYFDDVGRVFTQLGWNIPAGVASGIYECSYYATDAVQWLASALKITFKNALSIFSPSREMAFLAEFIPAGIAKGIEDNAGEALGAVEGLADSLIIAIDQAMSRVSDVADADYSITPTITPVLDLTNTADGFSQLNSMLNSVGLNQSLGKIDLDTSVIDRSSNKDVVNELQAMNNRIAELAENMENIQIVLDTGVLVGSTSAMYDSQFGTMSMHKNRGN